MKKHRSVCIFCPFCGYQNRKKDRLLRHIETNHRENQSQDAPLDLTSPRKEIDHGPVNANSKTEDVAEETTQSVALDLSSPTKDDLEKPLDLSPPTKITNKDVSKDLTRTTLNEATSLAKSEPENILKKLLALSNNCIFKP